MIRTIFYDEYGRVTGRTEETPDENRDISKHDDGGAVQMTTEWKGTQRRPANPAFARHLNEEW